MDFKIRFGVRMRTEIDNCKADCNKIVKNFEDKIAKDLGLENDLTIFFFGVTEEFHNNPTTENFEKVWATYMNVIAEQTCRRLQGEI